MARISYVLDTSIFVEAHKGVLARDIVPGFWAILPETEGLCSVDRVLREINDYHDKTDALCEWANEIVPPSFFATTATPVIHSHFGQLMEWVSAQDTLKPTAHREFARAADGWVIALAMEEGAAVVSEEVSAPQAKKTVKIPDICIAHDVEHMRTVDLLRRLGAQFH